MSASGQQDKRTAGEWRTLGDQCVHDWNMHKAVFCYRKSLELDPDQPDLWGKTASLAAKHDVGDARALVDQALERYPDNIEALALKTELVSRYWPPEVSADPGEPVVLTARGGSYSRDRTDHQVAESISWIDKALRLKPEDIDLLFRKANCLEYHLDREEQAEELYDHILHVLPDDVGALIDAAQRFSYDKPRVFACLDRALALSSGDVVRWIAAARQCRKLSAFNQTQKCLERAEALEPDNKQLWSERFYLLKAMGRIDEARAIPLAKTSFRYEVNLLDFLLTGAYCSITPGMRRDEVRARLGEPNDWGGSHASWGDPFCGWGLGDYPIWWYGAMEFHFSDSQKLHLIWCDHLDWIWNGGDVIKLDAWIFEDRQPINRAAMQSILDKHGIEYTVRQSLFSVDFVLSSGVEIICDLEEDEVCAISHVDRDFWGDFEAHASGGA